MTRKTKKNKKRSCGLCKPHKRGWENRWKHKVFDFIKRSDKEMRGNIP